LISMYLVEIRVLDIPRGLMTNEFDSARA